MAQIHHATASGDIGRKIKLTDKDMLDALVLSVVAKRQAQFKRPLTRPERRRIRARLRKDIKAGRLVVRRGDESV